MLSIIVPCYNEQSSLPLFYQEISSSLDSMEQDYELLFIDDGSDDSTLTILKVLSYNDDKVKYISFSRNFGKEAAIYAGFCNVKGDYVALMDCDMQDPPSLLPEMFSILQKKEYDCVATCRINRQGDPIIRSWFARFFYKIINQLSDIPIVDGARDFRIMTRSMADAIIRMGENNRFSKGLFSWIGFRTYWLPYENIERASGRTKWSFWKLFRYALDGITSFSQTPLNFSAWFGIFMTLVSFLALIFIVVRRLIFGDPVDGWASTVCIIIFIGGIQLFCLGIIGQYVAKIFLETKRRPHYIASETNLPNADMIH